MDETRHGASIANAQPDCDAARTRRAPARALGSAAMSERDTTSFGYEEVPRGEKAGRVREVFDRVADRYDLMNDLMSGGVHRIWKDLAVTRANPQPGERLIDIAGGTGDIALRWIRKAEKTMRRRGAGAPAEGIVIDVNEEMLRAGQARLGAETNLFWACGDAERLPLPDRIADAASIAFGIRNVTDRAAALAQARRVLKPGGRFVCLEFSRPAIAVLEAVYDRWSFDVIPTLGGWVAGDEAAYRYLVESIRRFPPQDAFADELKAAGFENVSYANYSGGVAALHVGWRL